VLIKMFTFGFAPH